MKKIKKILIANRGEIACRIIRTAKKMGIQTVAVYSDADRDSMHRHMADEAVYIGQSPAAASYLDMKKIFAALGESRADALHPGFGFLSENPDFVTALKKRNITFIGPDAKSIRSMGLKDAAKKLMNKAGVPVTPGYHGSTQSLSFLQQQAEKIGYPVLIKAVAGGGGKGMRKVTRKADFKQALESCKREATASFKDSRVLIEKYIVSPRHIEVQIFGDTHGNIIHLFERDCSLQRRYQKVIEEAPAPGMSNEMRAAMTDAAIKAARAVNYVGAGTIEFIVDAKKKLNPDAFWFMEMNTRLQVEHPITEMITGLDLVELQIRVARGEKLPEQSAIKMVGHGIEARLYSEDTENGFVPSVGRLDIFECPREGRVDIGVSQGAVITPFYDPMVGKLIAHAESRHEAITRLIDMCRQVKMYPVKNNARFLTHCLSHKEFLSGKYTTQFIDKNTKTLTHQTFEQDKEHIAFALSPKKEDGLFGDTSFWRLNHKKESMIYTHHKGEEISLSAKDKAPETDKITSLFHRPEGDVVFVDGRAYLFEKNISKVSEGISDGSVISPMPGNIVAVKVKPGEYVDKGTELLILEAMKMENVLSASISGIVDKVNVKTGTLVSDGDVLLTIKIGSKK